MVANRLALVALFCGPTALAAGPPGFDGVWSTGEGTGCAGSGEGAASIRIAEGVLHGVENECRMTRPLEVRGMDAVLYDMECAGDDGAAFAERAMIMKAADGGLYLVWNGYAFKYAPCDEGGSVSTAEAEGGGAAEE